MRTTIDQAGRVVIPKSIRDRLGLRGGTELEIREHEGRVDIEVVGETVFVDESGAKPVLRLAGQASALTDADVRELLERSRP